MDFLGLFLLIVSVIWLVLTPIVFPKLEPIEKIGWVVGIVLGFIEILTWIVGNIPFDFRAVIGAAAVIIIVLTATSTKYKLVPKNAMAQTTAPSIPTLPLEVSNDYVRMYDNKFEYKFENLLNDVKKTYWGLAVSHDLFSTVSERNDKIVAMLKDGISFRILLINPAPKKGEPEFLKLSQREIIPVGAEGTVEVTLKRFKDDIGGKLTPEKLELERLENFDWTKRFEVKLYNKPITHTMIIIDHAKIQLEPYLYLPQAGATPIFIIENSKRPEVFKKLEESFEATWNDSRTHPVSWDSL
jgi:hypothetical protein